MNTIKKSKTEKANTVRSTKVISRGSFMKKPDKVELYEGNTLKLVLKESSKGSLNGKKGYRNRTYQGRASKAKIYGKVGSTVTFYDDQQFRKGENYVTIIKLIDGPVEVQLNKNFVDRKEEAGDDKIYMPSESLTKHSPYKWIFVKKVKKSLVGSILDFIIPFADWEDIKRFLKFVERWAEDLEIPYVKTVSRKVVKTSSKNYRVDNCSSVEFGAS